MIRSLLRRQTLASFDYQWRELPDGAALVSDEWFLKNVDRIVADELLALRREWFVGKEVLDAGCGIGRWTVGLLRLGCSVTAVDASVHALQGLHENVALVCTDQERSRLTTAEVDLLGIPADLAARRFDLVFSFGVLHHTGDTKRALERIAPLAGDEGMLFAYLYGKESVPGRRRVLLELERFALAPLPYSVKKRLITFVFRSSDPHLMFDLLSPTVNTRHTFDQVGRWLQSLGFTAVDRTIDHSELFVRAARSRSVLERFATESPRPPYWFERYG